MRRRVADHAASGRATAVERGEAAGDGTRVERLGAGGHEGALEAARRNAACNGVGANGDRDPASTRTTRNSA
jgi:hypothetical protein